MNHKLSQILAKAPRDHYTFPGIIDGIKPDNHDKKFERNTGINR